MKAPTAPGELARRVVAWQKQHGRHHLPWQNTQDPYRVWLSEVMLQQTQVATASGYFNRFLARLPTLQHLADASLDEVLGLWSGLGYYSRARNLHRCAQTVVRQHRGVFPRSAEVLETLPGIGRSTAAAIASLCFGQRVAILDANVKRVVARVVGFDGDVALAVQQRALWDAATALLPSVQDAPQAMARYTQGMMDLGSTVCLPKTPLCAVCPLQPDCQAHAQGQPQRYPVRSRKPKRSSQSLWLLWARTSDGAVWLNQRPTPGVWAALHCLPLFDGEAALHAAVPARWQAQLEPLPAFLHVLTHKDLHLHPWRLDLTVQESLGDVGGSWVAAQRWPGLGLPAPIRKLLDQSGSQ
ncbi:MAG: A/G-specific adenine glycosylase [Betaproteobacteria bacterium]